MRSMPRPATGRSCVPRRAWAPATAFGSATAASEVYHHIGGSWEGWTEERVEAERDYVMGQVAARRVRAAAARRSAPTGARRASDVPGVRVDRARPQEAAGRREDRQGPRSGDSRRRWITSAATGWTTSTRVSRTTSWSRSWSSASDREGRRRRAAATRELHRLAHRENPPRRRRPLSNDSINKVLGRGAAGAQGGEAPTTDRPQPHGGSRVLPAVPARRSGHSSSSRRSLPRSSTPHASSIANSGRSTGATCARSGAPTSRPHTSPRGTGYRHTHSPHPPRRDLDRGASARGRPPSGGRDAAAGGAADSRAVEARPLGPRPGRAPDTDAASKDGRVGAKRADAAEPARDPADPERRAALAEEPRPS